MNATILSGKDIAKRVISEIEEDVRAFKDRHDGTPAIAIVRAGEDPGSVWYARAIEKTMKRAGMRAELRVLGADATQTHMLDIVSELNADPKIHGIMVQEPMPKAVDDTTVRLAILPAKDVDGVHEVNAGRLMLAQPVGRAASALRFHVPATPAGGVELMRRRGVEFTGKHVVIVGRSEIVGKPLAMMLLRENATVTMCHSRTQGLSDMCRQADILCVAVGRPKMIRGDWIRDGAVVIDFGINEVDGRMVGDVDFVEAVSRAAAITPVPGGTGPMTNAMLCRNLLNAAMAQQDW